MADEVSLWIDFVGNCRTGQTVPREEIELGMSGTRITMMS
jgi:hypothetical protein